MNFKINKQHFCIVLLLYSWFTAISMESIPSISSHRQIEIKTRKDLTANTLGLDIRQHNNPIIGSSKVQLKCQDNDRAVLQCILEPDVELSENLKILWFRNNKKLRRRTPKILLNEQNNLCIIEKPKHSDSGYYHCEIHNNNASNPPIMRKRQNAFLFSSSSLNANDTTITRKNCLTNLSLTRNKRDGGGAEPMEPSGLSFVDKQDHKLTVDENKSLELLCQFDGLEKFKIPGKSLQLIWRKDFKVIRKMELNPQETVAEEPARESILRDDPRLALNPSTGSLHFSTVVATDAGQYVCQILVEGFKPVTSPIREVQVNEQLKFMPQPTSKNLEFGNVGKVHCKAQGTPTPHVQWIKGKTKGEPLQDDVEDLNGTLIFKNVKFEDKGLYTCIARNKKGKINATVTINVVVAPKFSMQPGSGDEAIETDEKATVSIHCQATGDPKPTIQWDKDLEYLSENNTDKTRLHFFPNGTLQIRDLHSSDEGRYGCTIGNSAGLKREEVRLVVKPIEGFLTTRAVLITISVAFAYIILAVGLMVWCRYRRRAKKSRRNDGGKSNGESGESPRSGEAEPCLQNTENTSLKVVHKTNGNNNPQNETLKSDDTVCSNQSKHSKRSHFFDELSLPRNAISDRIIIGHGEFGDVFVAKIKASVVNLKCDTKSNDEGIKRNKRNSETIEEKNEKQNDDDINQIIEESDETDNVVVPKDNSNREHELILIKALNKAKDEAACNEFKRQIEMFHAISHKGIVQLYGLCRDKDPHYMILEYTDWGDLKQFLLATEGKNKNATADQNAIPPLKTPQILAIAYQIARGMDALYRARFIHKDLATRNCVITSDFTVKVSYPSLCKDKYNQEYYKYRNHWLPIRWLAPECIDDDEYTIKSDVWAFSVLAWELFVRATKIPFEELSNEEVLQGCRDGKLDSLSGQEQIPECLRKSLESCFNRSPKDRPSFSQLCSSLSKALQNDEK